MALAFLPIPPAVTTETLVESKPKLPEFKPRWWYRSNRLDGRPVVWSLDNRPEEWEYIRGSHMWLRHKPSNHNFFFVGPFEVRLEGHGCSCGGKTFQTGHQRAMTKAYLRWRRKIDKPQHIRTQEQFTKHFIHD